METFNIKCPHCNGELEVNTEWIGMETACPICSKSFTISNTAESGNSLSNQEESVKNVSANNFNIKCPHCNGELEVNTEWIGMETACPICSKAFVIPDAAEDRTKNDLPLPETIPDAPILDLPQNVSRQDAKRLRSTAEKCIDNWLQTIPGAEGFFIKQILEFREISVCDLFILRSDMTFRTRTFKKFERPYLGEKLPKQLLVPGESDFWRFNPDEEKDFTSTIDETLEAYTCHKCYGKTHVNCPVCNGHKKVACKKCKGSGLVDCYRCRGRGQVDLGGSVSKRVTCSNCEGRGFLHYKDDEMCPLCHGKGCNYKDVHVEDWHTCNVCDGSGSLDCSNCHGTGEVKCTNCNGSGHVTCPTCTGTGKLKSGYDLIQRIVDETHYNFWSAESGFSYEKLYNEEALADSGETLFQLNAKDIQRHLPQNIDPDLKIPMDHMLTELDAAYPIQVFRRFNKHKMKLSKTQFISYCGVSKSDGKKICFRVDPKTGVVIDENGFLNNLFETVIEEADAEKDPVKSIRLAAKAFVLNQDSKNRIPEKLLFAKDEQFYSYFQPCLWLGILTGCAVMATLVDYSDERNALPMCIMSFSPLYMLSMLLFIGYKTSRIYKSFLYNIVNRMGKRCKNSRSVFLVSFLWGLSLASFYGFSVLWIWFLSLFVRMFFRRPTYEKKYDYCKLSVEKFKKDKTTLQSFAPAPFRVIIFTLIALGVPLFGSSIIVSEKLSILSGIILLAGFVISYWITKSKEKTKKGITRKDVIQDGLNIGPWADRSDVLALTDVLPYSAVIVSIPEDRNAVKTKINKMVKSFGPFEKYTSELPKDFKFKSPFVVASAVSPELLSEPVKALRSVDVEIQIINQKDDRSEEFKKSNPAVSFDKLNKDRPYAICLFHVGKMPEACCKLISETKGEVFTVQELENKIKEQTLVQLFSAATEELLQKIAADFRAVGAGVKIIALDDKNSYQLILLSAGEKQQEVQELASNYISEKQCVPVALLNGTTKKDAEICKAQFDAIGAETVILPFGGVSQKKTKNSCSIRLSSLGNSPQKVIQLLKCFGTELDPEGKGFPIHVLSANTPQTLLEHLNCLKQAGAVVWIKDKRKNSSTYRVLLLRNGKNREQTRSLLLTCSLNEHIRGYDEIIPPLEIMTQITPQDAELCQKYFSEIGAVTVALNSDVVFDIGRDYKFMLYISSPGKNPEAVAVLVNLMRNKKDIVETIFEKNLTPIVSSQNADLLIPYLNALLDYGASAWIMNIDDADEKYNIYITDVAEMTPTLKNKINEIIGYKLEMTEERLKLPIKLLSDAIPQDIERCSALFRDDPGVKLLSLDYVPELKDGDKKECELVVFNKGNDPEFFDTLMKCCASNDYKEKISGSNLPLTICESTSPEKLKSHAECLRIAGGSAWICSYSETVTTYKVVISDFGNTPEKTIDLIRKYAFNYQFWQNRTPVAPVILMTNLLKTESAVLGAICQDCGAVISYIKEETDHEFKDPYRIMITSAGKHRDNVAALLQAWKIADSEITKLYSETPIYVFQAKEEKELLPRLELFRISGASAWICKPNDPQRTFKVMLESIGPNREQVMQLLSQFSISSINGISDQQTKAIEIIKNLTKTSAEECNSLFQSIGANTYCCNFLGDKI